MRGYYKAEVPSKVKLVSLEAQVQSSRRSRLCTDTLAQPGLTVVFN